MLYSDEKWMQLALEQARAAEAAGEVPVGAVVICGEELVGAGHNRNLTDKDPAAHAEVVALRQAGLRLGNHRLSECEIFVTIEPCAMCAGAVVHARLARLVFGAADPKAGAAGSVMNVLNHPELNHRIQVVSGILAEESSLLIKQFFQQRRKKE